IRTKRYTADLCTVVLGSRALPDWLEGRGGVSQEFLDLLVFRVARLQQYRPGLGILFSLRLPTIALKANRPRCHHTRGKEVMLFLIRQRPLKPRFPFFVLRLRTQITSQLQAKLPENKQKHNTR